MSRELMLRVCRDGVRLLPGLFAHGLGVCLLNIIIAGNLPMEEYADFVWLWTAITWANVLFCGWIHTAALRDLPGVPAKLPDFIAMLKACSIIQLVALTPLCICAANVVRIQDSLLAAVLASLFATHASIQVFLRAMFRLPQFSINAVFVAVAIPTGVWVSVTSFSPTITVSILSLICVFVVAIGGQIWQLKSQLADSARRVTHRNTILGESLQYGLPIAIGHFLILFLMGGDRYLLPLFNVRQSEIAIYCFWMIMGFQVGRLVISVCFKVVNPRLFELHAKDPISAIRTTRRFTILYVVFVPPLLAISGLIFPRVVAILGVEPAYVEKSYYIWFPTCSMFLFGLAQLCAKPLEFEKRSVDLLVASVCAGGGLLIFALMMAKTEQVIMMACCGPAAFLTYLIVICILVWRMPIETSARSVLPDRSFLQGLSRISSIALRRVSNRMQGPRMP